MSLYKPGTTETDQKKQNRAIQGIGTATEKAQSDIGDLQTSTSTLQTSVTALQSSVAALASGIPDIIIEDQKTSGTAGGTNTAGSYQTRDLNILVRNNGTIASLSSNEVALPAGTYYFRWSVPAFAVDLHKSRLQNITDSATVAYGEGGHSPSTGGSQVDSTGSAVVTISASKSFALQHYTFTSQTNLGFGRAISQGTEVYSRLEIWKMG